MSDSRQPLQRRFPGILGDSPAMQGVLRAADQAVPTEWPILITGETGTGKSMLASAIHRASKRPGKFVVVNCAALPPSLLESELFGHSRGAFTGADRDAPGLFEVAHDGTLLLDEIGDLAAEAQAKLLRVIETGMVRRVGSQSEVPVEVRLICATHQPLESHVEAGTFRRDLYYRINTVVLEMPPLRERLNDLPALAQMFLEAADPDDERQLDADALDKLRRHSWPGNLRELQSMMRQAVLQAGTSRTIGARHLGSLRDIVGSPAARGVRPYGSDDDEPETRLRAVLAGNDAGNTVQLWARFLLTWSREHATSSLARRTFLDLLRRIRGPAPSDASLKHEWQRSLRGPLIETGLVRESGKSLEIDLAACEAAFTARSVPEPPPFEPSPTPESQAPAPVSAVSIPAAGNLPRRPIDLVGRDDELDHLTSILRDGRLPPIVTLTGPGGVGKTSLARRAGQLVAPDFPGGCWFVDLCDARTADDAARAVGGTLGLTVPDRDPVAGVGSALALRDRMALILDNLEQVAGGAQAVMAWTDHAPAVRLLVTSRARPGVRGETPVTLAPLAIPDAGLVTSADLADVRAVELFVLRARQVRPDFAVTDDNAGAIASICRQLDGLPLAIELAASRLGMLDVDQLQARLRQSLERSGQPVASHDQRTLRGTLDWSLQLLTAPQRIAFARQCVFHGGFRLESAEEVLPPLTDGLTVMDALQALLDHSLIRTIRAGNRAARFECLHVIQRYGIDLLDELVSVDDRTELHRQHAAHFVRAGLQQVDELRRARPQAALDALEEEFDNLAAAFRWAAANSEPDLHGGAALALAVVTLERGEVSQVVGWLDDALSGSSGTLDEALRLRLLHQRARASANLNDVSAWNGLQQMDDAVESARQASDGSASQLVADGLYWRGVLRHIAGDPDGAIADLVDSEAVCAALGDDTGVATCQCVHALVLAQSGALDDALGRMEQASQLARQTDGARMLPRIIGGLGMLRAQAGELQQAIPLFAEAAELSAAMGMARVQCTWTLHQARSEQACGNSGAATTLRRVAEQLARHIGDRDLLADVVAG